MEDLRNLIDAGASKLEALAKKIPGFSGYLERENRREADAIQREAMAKRLTKLKDEMQSAQSDLLSSGNLAIMEPFDRIANKLDRSIERVRHASRGYAGFFDAVKVNEDELDRIYDYDVTLFDSISSAEEALTALISACDEGGNPTPLVKALEKRVTEFDKALDGREEILRGIA